MKCSQAVTVKNGFVILEKGSIEAYIPMKFFDHNIAYTDGVIVQSMGIFNCRCYDTSDKPDKLETFNFPTRITMYPSSIEDATLELIPGNPDKYKVLKFLKGDKLMPSVVESNSEYVEIFLNMVMQGNIPKTIPYSAVKALWDKNLEINKVSFGVPSTILEVLLAQAYRNADKLEEPFARKIGKDPSKVSEYSYATANMREISARTSTFAALTFEDFDAMLTISLNRNAYNKDEAESPVEKIIRY